MFSGKKLVLAGLLAGSMSLPAQSVAQVAPMVERSSPLASKSEKLGGAGLPVILIAGLVATISIIAVASSGGDDQPGSP
jgi:hypothetical protein